MGLDDMSVEGVLGITICIASLLLHVISVILPSWSYLEEDVDNSAKIGLWKLCSAKCAYLPEEDVPEWLKGVRAMEMLGLIAGCAANILVFVSGFVKKDSRVFSALAAGACFAAAVFTFLGFVVFSAKKDSFRTAYFYDKASDMALNHGTAYILNVMGFIGFMVCSFVSLFCSLIVRCHRSRAHEEEEIRQPTEETAAHPTDIQVIQK